jgi:hypothetical protein
MTNSPPIWDISTRGRSSDLPDEPPRAPGLWVPFAAIGVVVPIVGFAIAFIGQVRVMERHLDEIEDHLDRIDRVEDVAAETRQDHAVRLGRIEAAIGVDRRGHP